MFERIADDSVSGATTLTELAAREMASLAETWNAGDPGGIWDELLAACTALVDAKREMASIVNFVSRLLAAAERVVLSGLSPEAVVQVVSAECARTWQSIPDDLGALGREGADLIRPGAAVVTLSSSGSVRAVLDAARAAGTAFRVVASEGSPRREGAALADDLARAGFDTTLVVDAALPRLVERADLVLVGADCVSAEDFVNKIGTYPLLLAAADAGVPSYAAALLDKFLPKALRGSTDAVHPPEEVVADPPDGLEIDNHYFEAVPTALLKGVVTESGIVEPSDIPERLREQAVAPALLGVLFRKAGPTT